MEKVNIDFGLVELTGLPNEFFTENRTNYLTNLNAMLSGMVADSVIILQGGDEIPRNDTDVVNYHFSQESNFYYLSGVTESKFYAVLDLKDSSFTLFYDLDKDERDQIFMKIPTLQELSDKYQLPVFDMVDFYSELKKRNPQKIYLLNGVNSDSGLNIHTAKLSFPPGYEDLAKLLDHNPYVYEILAETRTKKTQNEIKLLRYICKITIEAHLQAYKRVMPDVYEHDIENGFYNYLRKSYYTRLWSYPQICGCGKDSATLHYDKNNNVLKKGDLMLMDMGIRFGGYCSDITSTIPVSGTFTSDQAKIYQIVLSANREVIKNLKPGVFWPDMHLLAERVILKGLIEIGILNNLDIEDMLRDRVCYYFMPHGLGHFMGLEVHDVGGYLSFTPKRLTQLGLASLRTARYLAVDNVITVEPGIYFIPFLLDQALKDDNLKKYFNLKVRDFYNFGGIRIEDDVLITEDGAENLTEALPRNVKDIENIMKKK